MLSQNQFPAEAFLCLMKHIRGEITRLQRAEHLSPCDVLQRGHVFVVESVYVKVWGKIHLHTWPVEKKANIHSVSVIYFQHE